MRKFAKKKTAKICGAKHCQEYFHILDGVPGNPSPSQCPLAGRGVGQSGPLSLLIQEGGAPPSSYRTLLIPCAPHPGVAGNSPIATSSLGRQRRPEPHICEQSSPQLLLSRTVWQGGSPVVAGEGGAERLGALVAGPVLPRVPHAPPPRPVLVLVGGTWLDMG